MHNATLAANAAPMPCRLFLAAGPAAAVFAAVRSVAARAAVTAEPDLRAAVERVRALHRRQDVARARLSVLEGAFVEPGLPAALKKQRRDFSFFGALARDGEELSPDDVVNAQHVCVKLRIPSEDPTGLDAVCREALDRVTEVAKAAREHRIARELALAAAGIDDAQAAFDAAVNGLFDAQDDLVDMRPGTLTGLVTQARALLETGAFEGEGRGEAI